MGAEGELERRQAELTLLRSTDEAYTDERLSVHATGDRCLVAIRPPSDYRLTATRSPPCRHPIAMPRRRRQRRRLPAAS